MLRLRLIYGLSLTGLIIGLMLVDAYMSARLLPPAAPCAGETPARWLFNGAVCAALLSVLVWLGAHELVGLARAEGYDPSAPLAQLGAVGLVLGPYVTFNWPGDNAPAQAAILLWLALVLALAFLRQVLRRRSHQALASLSSTMFIVIYLGGLGHFLCRLRMEVGGELGVALLLYSVFLVKMADTGAYFTGRWFGRRKLIPWLSPHKTWEGLAGGVVVALLCAVGVGHWLHAAQLAPLPPTGPLTGWLVLFGLLMAGLSVAGDLFASLLKRGAAVKDSGKALPGLGGILDVLDSPLLAAPAAWLFWIWWVRPGVAP